MLPKYKISDSFSFYTSMRLADEDWKYKVISQSCHLIEGSHKSLNFLGMMLTYLAHLQIGCKVG